MPKIMNTATNILSQRELQYVIENIVTDHRPVHQLFQMDL